MNYFELKSIIEKCKLSVFHNLTMFNPAGVGFCFCSNIPQINLGVKHS